VKEHLLCLTVDTDPDGLSGKVINRQTLRWNGLEHLQTLSDDFAAAPEPGPVPLTWFVRADGQLESILGTPSYLLEKYATFWSKVGAWGHELAWHPHLYRQQRPDDAVALITDPNEAQDELERLWSGVKPCWAATAFRNGEGWHTQETYAMVERLGFHSDSTAIPGRSGPKGHPMNWVGAPNEPYFPQSEDLCKSGRPRDMLEIPMNTWFLQAPHDPSPRLRYMNPAVHCSLFAKALESWENACKVSPSELSVWVMIFHPDELLETQGADGLYSRSIRDLRNNLQAMADCLRRLEHKFEWTTLSYAGERWRAHHQCMVA
jgi:hypothetical protein